MSRVDSVLVEESAAPENSQRVRPFASGTPAQSGAVWLAVATLVWLGLTSWARPLMLPDGGRYVGVAWEMVATGEWLTPRLDGLPYFHKPPLFYWITAAALSVFGPVEWAARVAPLLGAWICAMAIYLFLRRWADMRLARLSLLLLLVQPLLYIGAQFANLDMLVAGCITAAIVLLAHAALSVEAGLPHRGALLGAYAFAALGILAKGLIGAVIPALVILPWLALRGRLRLIAPLCWLPAWLLFLAIAAPWFVAMELRFPGFLDYFFVVQHFGRYTASGFSNANPGWFFPAVLLLFFLPWLPWLFKFFARGNTLAALRSPVSMLMALWVLMVVLFFSLPQSKLVGYVLPAVAPLVVLCAMGYASTARPGSWSRRGWGPPSCWRWR